MKDFSNNLILYNIGIIEAMQKLNKVPETLTLFVVDEKQKLLGTLTDGDIRRGFIKGLTLSDLVSSFMITNFRAIKNGFSLTEFKKSRLAGIRLLPVLNEADQITKIYDLKKRKSILPLECVIMAGGRGLRLGPLTDKTPKPMLPLGGMPIIEHNIDRLISFGIETIYISVRYLGQQIVDYFGDGSSKGISIQYIWEDEPLGTVGALSLVNQYNTDHILVMNSDLFTDADFEDLYLTVLEKKADMGVASVKHNVRVPYGIFREKDNYINGIKEKPIFTNYANAGIYIFNRKIIQQIPRNRFFNITDLMELMIKNNQTLIHNPIIGYWVDIGQPQDYLNAQEIVKHRSAE